MKLNFRLKLFLILIGSFLIFIIFLFLTKKKK